MRGKDRKESLSRQKRMDQLKDRFQFAGGSKDEPNTSDDEDSTYGPKISGAVRAEKIPTSQKTDQTDSNSDSHNAGEMGGKRKCKEVIDDLQALPCKKVSSVSEGGAGQSNVATECSTLTVKDSDLKEGACGMNVEEKKNVIDRQRVEKREKDDVVHEPAHLHWREGYDRVLPEVRSSFEGFSYLVLLSILQELLSDCMPDECLVCKVKLPRSKRQLSN